MQKMKRLISLLLVLALCLSLTACFDISGYLPSTQETTEDGLTTYHITVRTHSGQYLENVGVRVFADTEKTDLVWYDKTDAQGHMSFIADTFDGYVVALENIPDGYAAAAYYTLTGVDSEIVLSIGLQTGVDLNTTNLNLGSHMIDLAVTAVDGREYTLSNLLASHKAVALCFFDSGAADGLACLEQVWKGCADEVAVLALNPVDSDVSGYAQGLSLPIAGCESGWIGALGLTQFPTLVVVDRYGIISLIHEGPVSDTEVYRDVFAFFARNDYTPEVVEDIASIIGKELQGTADNPYIADASADIMVSVEPGGMVHYSVYKAQDMLLTIRSANAWVLYEGETLYPENGVITLQIDTPDTNTPVSLGIGNAGSNTELFVARFSYQQGTQGNPYPVEPGQFTAQLAAGEENSLFYLYKAVKPGTLRFTCTAQTEGVAWQYTATNQSTGIQVSSQESLLTDELTGEQYMLLEVSANDVVIIAVGTVPDETTGEYPAGTFQILFAYEGSSEKPDHPLPPGTKTDYSVTVQDSFGVPLMGVTVNFTDLSGTVSMLTDENGTAAFTNTLGGVTVTIVPLPGYTVPKAEFHLTSSTNNVSVVFTGKMEGEFTALPVGDAYHVVLGDNYAIMNAGAVNYFLFTPTQAGQYRFSAGAQLSFWGTDLNNIAEHTAEAFLTEDGFILNISAENVGKPHILGMTGAPNATLTVTWVGDIVPDPSTEPTAG